MQKIIARELSRKICFLKRICDENLLSLIFIAQKQQISQKLSSLRMRYMRLTNCAKYQLSFIILKLMQKYRLHVLCLCFWGFAGIQSSQSWFCYHCWLRSISIASRWSRRQSRVAMSFFWSALSSRWFWICGRSGIPLETLLWMEADGIKGMK